MNMFEELSQLLAKRDEEKKRLITEVAELRQPLSWKLTAPFGGAAQVLVMVRVG